MSERNKVVPDSMLSKEFLSQFKTEADVSKFLNQLHSQVLEKMLEGEMDVLWVMKRTQWQAIIAVIPVMVSIPRRFKRNIVRLSYPFLVTVMVSSNLYGTQA